MRFKAKLAPEQVSLLYSLVQPLARLASSASTANDTGASSVWLRNGSVLYLDDKHVRFSCKGKSLDTDGITCFAELQAGGGIFLEHRIESAAEHNVICMELDLAQLKVALQSVASSSSSSHNHEQEGYTVLKLAKRNGLPCLCLETAATSVVSLQVHQAIPVRILRPQDIPLPPQTSLPAVQLRIPRDKQLKPILEQLKAMGGSTVYVHGSGVTGECTLGMDHRGAAIQIYLGKLVPIMAATTDDKNDDDDNVNEEENPTNQGDCTLKVDVRKLCAAWQWPHPCYVSNALLCLVENEQLVLHVTLDPELVGFFTYYVPVHYYNTHNGDDDDNDDDGASS